MPDDMTCYVGKMSADMLADSCGHEKIRFIGNLAVMAKFLQGKGKKVLYVLISFFL